MFDRFARGSSGQGAPGTGLGLAIVATLARRWGGSARISNRASGGARPRSRSLRLRLQALCKPLTGAWTRLYPVASSLVAMRIAVIALSGLVFATGLGFAAHMIARDTVALPVASLDASENLAPAATTTERTRRRPLVGASAGQPRPRARRPRKARPHRLLWTTTRATEAGVGAVDGAATTRAARAAPGPEAPALEVPALAAATTRTTRKRSRRTPAGL